MSKRARGIKLALMRLIVKADDEGFAMREEDLVRDLRGIHPAPGMAEVREVLTTLDGDQLVVTVPDDDTRRFSPTSLGRAWKMKEEQGL